MNLNPWRDASPVQQDFILSQEFEVCLMGPRGEGKTEAGIRRMTLHAAEQPAASRPIPWAIVRDTWTNLERTTLKSFLMPHEGSFAAQIRPLLRVRDGGRQVELPGLWIAYLMGMDSIGDLDKLQSLQLGGLWIEEPAPAASEEIGGGIEERVVTVGVTSLRHPCSYRTVQLTSNYPDEDHWSWRRYGIERIPGRKLFRIPRGENTHLPSDYRENMERSLAGDVGLLQRLVLGQPGFVCQGEAVTPEYDPDGIAHGWKQGHKSKVELEPYPNLMGYLGFDGGLNPTCTFNQMTARGHLLTFKDTLVGQNIGMRQLCRDHIKPLLEEVYYMVPEWEAEGDPSMFNREQSDASQTAAFIIEDELKIPFRPGPVQWDVRRNAMKTALNKTIDGLPFWCFCHAEQKLHKALRGGWHYRKDASGRVMRHKPVKDIHSHPADAASYVVCELLSLSSRGLVDAYVYPEDREYEAPQYQRTGASPVTGY